MTHLNYIVWNPDLEFFRFLGLSVRYYSLMWCFGLVGAYFIVKKIYNDCKIDKEKFEPLFLYCFIGIIIGARLGHCLFYEPEYYLSSFENFIEMLLPIEFTQQGVKLTGYRGLASHGGTIGIFIAIWLYSRKYKISILSILDIVCIATPLTAFFIRFGNLMNSEIVGKATNSEFGFVFKQLGENFPRHPAQLYEAIAYLIIFIIGLLIYKNHKNRIGTGFYFGFCLFTIFTFRLFVEFLKEVQSTWEKDLVLNMGQLLSIPFIMLGLYFIIKGIKKGDIESKQTS